VVSADRPSFQHTAFRFWPGGGGDVIEDAATIDYYAYGSWNSWDAPEAMSTDRRGNYFFVITLGELGYESFQIIESSSRGAMALHPGREDGDSGSPVYGPDESDQAGHWTIDGRVVTGTVSGSSCLDDSAVWTNHSPSGVRIKDRGLPGDKYSVRLQVAGKWRNVAWQKIHNASPEDISAYLGGSYFVCGSFTNHQMSEMHAVVDSPGLYRYEFTLRSRSATFIIVRNEDRNQCFYQPSDTISGEVNCFGPGSCDLRVDRYWRICGGYMDRFVIEFSRMAAADGSDKKCLRWRKIDSGSSLTAS